MRTTSLASVVLSFALIAVLIGGATAAASPKLQEMPDEPELSGVVTLNGDLAPAGVRISASLDDGTLCGSGASQTGGQYDLVLTTECLPGETLLFQLEAVGKRAATEVAVPDAPRTVNIAFEGLSREDLLALGVVEAAPAKEDEALITGNALMWLLLTVIAGELALLGLMVLTGSLVSNETWRRQTFKRQIEAMVLLGVTVAIILLGMAEKIGEEGLVSVLAAIVGYTVGRGMAETGGEGS